MGLFENLLGFSWVLTGNPLGLEKAKRLLAKTYCMPADESSQIWLKTKLNLKKLKTTKKCCESCCDLRVKDPEIRINFAAHLPHPEVTIHSPVSSLRWDAWIGNWMWSTTPILHQVPPGVRVSLFTASICGTKKGTRTHLKLCELVSDLGAFTTSTLFAPCH